MFENISWDWIQDAKSQTPMFQWLKTTFGHMTKKLDEIHEVNAKSANNQALMLAETSFSNPTGWDCETGEHVDIEVRCPLKIGEKEAGGRGGS